MESLTKQWSKLSLNDREGGGFHLTKERGSKEFIIAAKFLTKWVLSTEAIIRTLSPLWWARNGFQIRNAKDHVVLFVFEDEVEVGKILTSEPWSFDKHLMILQRYEKTIPIKELVFDKVMDPSSWSFRMFYETGCCWRNLWGCRSCHRSSEDSEVERGSYLQIQVTVDVSLPLCRGCIISLEKGIENWVSFKYERLPNICYWCGCLNHVDKDCDRWIESDGTLTKNDQ